MSAELRDLIDEISADLDIKYGRRNKLTEFERMIQFLDLAWKRKDQIVPCLIGPVGIGKTAAVRQHAKNVGAKNVVTIIASQILPSEVSGITMPDSATKSMEIYDHYKLSSLEDGDILFFDELLEADQCVLSACLTLIESRMMMSGKILPDIQIIAATNPTVNPANVRENIRQRFMFMEFEIDKDSVASYIEKHAGFKPDNFILSKLESTSKDFNILSPRSLTKLCEWIAATGDDRDELTDLCAVIDKMFNSTIGSDLGKIYLQRNNAPEMQARRAMKEVFLNNASDSDVANVIRPLAQSGKAGTSDELLNEKFNETSMDELVDMLHGLESWDKIAEQLANLQVEEAKDFDEIKF